MIDNKIVLFDPSHLDGFDIHPYSKDELCEYALDEVEHIIDKKNTLTILVNNKPIIIGGIVNINNENIGWIIFSSDWIQHKFTVIRLIKKVLSTLQIAFKAYIVEGRERIAQSLNILYNNIEVINNRTIKVFTWQPQL